MENLVLTKSSYFSATYIVAAITITTLAGCDQNEVVTSNLEEPLVTQDPVIIISEASSANTIFQDGYGNTPDWVEIRNITQSELDLNGWSLTDDSSEPSKWMFPDYQMEAGEYLLLWASGRNEGMHTSFKISSKGETLSLFDPSGNLVNDLEVAGVANNISIGRSLQGRIVFYDRPTPGYQNSSEEYDGVTENQPIFSHDGGIFSDQVVSLSGANEHEVIRFTRDATVPTNESNIYTQPISVDDDTVIRARIFREGYIPSQTNSRVFINSKTHDLPIVSLISAPENFFDEAKGIYVTGNNVTCESERFSCANYGEDWERDVHFSFYEPSGELGIAIDGGVKIFGGFSRTFAQKSLSIFARGRYGDSEIDYPLFPALDYQEFQSVVLRNAGNDWMKANMRDLVSASVMEGSGLEIQSFRSVAVYLNGTYWGLYNLREKISDHFLDDKIDVTKSQINLLENNSNVIDGDNKDYLELINFVYENDLSDQENYAFVSSKIDIQNFIKYQAAQIYLNNQDWPGNNVKFWNSPETKWRWILYDTDFGWDLYDSNAYSVDSLSYALGEAGGSWVPPDWSNLLLRRLVENMHFRNALINQFSDYFNSRFNHVDVINKVASITASMENEMQYHYDRWSGDFASNEHNHGEPLPWRYNVGVIEEFAAKRVDSLSRYISRRFGLTGTYSLAIAVDGGAGGHVLVNSLSVTNETWQGDYFNNVPVSVTAVPNENYHFSHWRGDIESTENMIEVRSDRNVSVVAVFVEEN